MVVCAGLALSSAHTFLTLSTLRVEYLANLGHETFRSIHLHARTQIRSKFEKDEIRRHRPKVLIDSSTWKAVLKECFSHNQENLLFLAVMDPSRNLVAGVGDMTDEASKLPEGLNSINGVGVFIMERGIPGPPGHPRRKKRFHNHSKNGTGTRISGSGVRSDRKRERPKFKDIRFRIGIKSSSAMFIMKQAEIHLVTSSLAIVSLLALAFYFLRTLKGFLYLQEREKSERHLAALGRMGATLAHEIRNPLGAMKGLTQVVQEELPANHESQQSLKTVISEAERLEHLVNDLLSYAKPKTVKIRKINLNKLFDDIKNIIQHKLRDSEVTITLNPGEQDVMILFDENGLRQVLLNIIINAIEVTPSGKNVNVNTTVHEKTKEVVIEIIDEGEGIGDRNPEELFEPFMTTKLKGTGLGLSISRQILERLDGTIRLMNKPNGVGAKCVINLPSSAIP